MSASDLVIDGRPADPPGRIVAIAASLGGLHATSSVLAALPADFPVPVVVVQHLAEQRRCLYVDVLAATSPIPVRWARTGGRPRAGIAYVAPPGRHTRLERARFHLTDAPRVNYARPAADLLFASVASGFGARAIAVVLTGRLHDGAAGALAVRRAGGLVIVQDPDTCAAPGMPRAAIAAGAAHFVLPPNAIGRALVALMMTPGAFEMFGVRAA